MKLNNEKMISVTYSTLKRINKPNQCLHALFYRVFELEVVRNLLKKYIDPNEADPTIKQRLVTTI